MSENEKLVAVSDNGKRWRIVPEDNDWDMVVVGHVTAGQAEKICRRIAEQATALTAAQARIRELEGFKSDVYAAAGKRPDTTGEVEPEWRVDLLEVERQALKEAQP